MNDPDPPEQRWKPPSIDQVRHEHQVIRGLLDRLAQMAHAIEGDTVVPEVEIREGLRLLEDYLDKVHIPGMGGSRSSAGSPDGNVGFHEATRDRLHSLGQMVSHYNTKLRGVRHAVARSLLMTAAADLEGEREEEQRASTASLAPSPTPGSPVAESIRRELEQAIARYLDPSRRKASPMSSPPSEGVVRRAGDRTP